MTYLNRPVFTFAVDWDEGVQRSLTFDLRQTALGFGAEYFTPTAEDTVNGWEFSLCHKNGNELLAFEAFADSLTGRLNGFWLPCPLQAAVFFAGVSTTQFNIVAEGLADTWNARPDQHLLFTFPDGTQAAAQIQNVTLNAGGLTERVTLATALPEIPSAGTVITRLHYVRFADDSEQLSFLSEGTATMKLSVVELPLEYTNAATGLLPIYLYHFRMKAPVSTDWYYTSFAAPVVSNGKVYAPWPMTHGPVKQTADGNSNPVDITAKPDPSHPFSLLAGVPPGKVLWCDILLCSLSTPDTAKKVFSGFVSNVEDDGVKYTAHCNNHQGLPVLVTDPLNAITTNGFDAKGRLTNRADSFGTTLYRYDADDNLTSIAENGLTNNWTFDAYDRVSSYQDIYGNLIQYRYDGNGNLTNLVYPGGRNVYYTYDSNNHMTSVTDWSGRLTTMTYDLNGRLTGVARPNGTSRILSYDSAGEVTNILDQMANGLPIVLMRYNWDQAARMSLDFIAPLPHTNSLPLRKMTYDADNELATFQGPTMGSAEPVTVDADGNLLSGPLTNDTFATYMYDVRNRMQNAGGVTNFYDAANNRIGQTYGTNSIEYVLSSRGKPPIILERIINGVTTYYVYGHGGLLYQINEAPTGTNTLTYHYDYRGSTIALSGDNGLVTDRMEYSVYGTMTYHAGTNSTPFLFAGCYNVQSDPDGLLYMHARYYNPYLCRFLNPDPTGFKGGMNFYAYANGNPASMIDPFGLDSTPLVTQTGNITANGDNITYQPVQPENNNVAETESSPYEMTSTTVGTAGVIQSGLENSPLDEATIGNNAKIYWSGWGGGSRAMITTYEIAPYLKIGGGAIAGASILTDFIGAENHDISWIHFGVNTGAGLTALYIGGPPGAIIGGTYFLFDQINSESNGWSDVYDNVLDGLYGPDTGDDGAGDP